MITIQKINENNIPYIVDWCRDKDERFLLQWGGDSYQYPLTAGQMQARLSCGACIYEILLDGQMAGTIEIIQKDTASRKALLGKFVLNPQLTGRGLGTLALKTFMEYCKKELSLEKLTIYVFDFNTGARKCYLKCGFHEVSSVIRPNGWRAIELETELI